jgi:hypothetical protein
MRNKFKSEILLKFFLGFLTFLLISFGRKIYSELISGDINPSLTCNIDGKAG